MVEVVKEVGVKKVILAIFDGGKDIQKAGKYLNALFPWLMVMWCVPHLLAIILKHIAEI